MDMGCVWTTYGLYVCCEGGAGCMWWPWGECGLPMGYVCAMREVRTACGSHVAMECVWTTYGLCMCCEGGASCMWWLGWP